LISRGGGGQQTDNYAIQIDKMPLYRFSAERKNFHVKRTGRAEH
jgi:hypothetical protein